MNAIEKKKHAKQMRPRIKSKEKKPETSRSKDKCGRCGYDKTHKKMTSNGTTVRFCKKIQSPADQKNSTILKKYRTLIKKKKKVSKNYPLCVLIEIKHVKEDEEFYVTAEIKVRFQLDSGAKPNVMSAKVYRASKQGLKLNTEKCKIRQTQVPYVGHLLTADGLKIDPHELEVKAIQEMPEPESKGDAKRVLGFVQFLTAYLPSL